MWKDIQVNMNEYFEWPNPRLKSMFGRIKRGNDQEYRTTFYKGKSLSRVLSDWQKHLKFIKDDWPGLWQFENDLANKVGPLSIQKPLSDRLDDIDSYWNSISWDSEPISEKAMQQVISEWHQLSGLMIRSEQKTLDKMKKSTNSGSPYYMKKRDVVDKTVPCDAYLHHTDELNYTMQNLRGSLWKSCAILGWRGQEGGLDFDSVKQRVVWMMPFGVNIKELQLYQPLVETCQKFNYVPAWIGMDEVDLRVTRLFDTKSDSDLIVCTDFTKFDQHFGPRCQEAARYLLSKWLSPNEQSRKWLNDVFPIKYEIPLIWEEGVMRYGTHGMGSGSGGTNADETIVHRCLQHEAALEHGAILNPNSMCLGDDGILTYPGITAKDVVDSYSKHGLEMNHDKQSESSDECTYLRRWHHKRYRRDGVCVGVYSTCRALGRLCEQERFYDPRKVKWGKEQVALRQLSILENCKFHPLREEFVDYCIKGDKYRLGLDIPGFFDKLSNIVKESINEMPDFLGYTKSLGKDMTDIATGINSWWIVNYLKSKR